LEAIRFAAHDEGLDDAARADGARQLVKSLFAEARAGLVGTWVDEVYVNVKE
jgi:hypothetical protein